MPKSFLRIITLLLILSLSTNGLAPAYGAILERRDALGAQSAIFGEEALAGHVIACMQNAPSRRLMGTRWLEPLRQTTRIEDGSFAAEMGFSKFGIRRNSGFDSQQPPTRLPNASFKFTDESKLIFDLAVRHKLLNDEARDAISKQFEEVRKLARALMKNPEAFAPLAKGLQPWEIRWVGIYVMRLLFEVHPEESDRLLNHAISVVENHPRLPLYALKTLQELADCPWFAEDASFRAVSHLIYIFEIIAITHPRSESIREQIAELLSKHVNAPAEKESEDDLDRAMQEEGSTEMDVDEESDDVQFEKKVESVVADHYALCRYFFEEIAGIPFMISLESFVSDANEIAQKHDFATRSGRGYIAEGRGPIRAQCDHDRRS
jgi:hypothetical protein